MEYPSAKWSAISVHLSRVLDEIGLNENTVKKRRGALLYMEHVQSIYSVIFFNSSMYSFGSQSEGTTTPGLDSDFDFLHCSQQVKVIQDSHEWTDGSKTHLLMLRDSTAPGYCQLQLMKRNRPEPEDKMPSQGFIYDTCNRIIQTNTYTDISNQYDVQTDRNGPANTHRIPDYFDSDITQAFMCSSRLETSEKWARRRNSGWPTARLIEQVVNTPCFLVPVGFKLSLTKNTEWRISMALAERLLMFSLNIVQIKCYVLLKMLMKTSVTPLAGKSISSYHCKTALFYCMENTKADFWKEDNLIQCIARCLEMILNWVTIEFCPNFIIAKANLFAGKVTSTNKGILQLTLRRLIQNTINFLLDVRMDGLGQLLQMKLGTKPNYSPILEQSIATIKLLQYFNLQKQPSPGAGCLEILSSWDHAKLISKVRQTIAMLESQTNLQDKLKQKANKHVITFLSGLLGSMLVSSSLARHARISIEAMDLLDTSATSDISSLLKQASILFCGGKVEHLEKIFRTISGHFTRNIVYPVSVCNLHHNYTSEQYQLMHTKRRNVRFARCVMFTRHEIHCVPKSLRYELFRAVGDDIQQRKPIDAWMLMVVVDCLPFFYYLQYMTYRELGKEELRKQSLHHLERCIRQKDQLLFYRETAWNILGQCYEMENQPAIALHCYRKSLDIRSRNNAANWLVPLLLNGCTH